LLQLLVGNQLLDLGFASGPTAHDATPAGAGRMNPVAFQAKAPGWIAIA
jgi:hypothetical protein